MNSVKTDIILIDDLNYYMEIDSNIIDTTEIINLSKLDLKNHTKLIAENFNIPFYTGGIVHMSDFCYIHESYSLDGYIKTLNKCI